MRYISLFSLMSMMFLISFVWAEEPIITENEAAAPAIANDLRELITQLDAESFPAREAASEKLASKGITALPALEEAIQAKNLEASSRAFEIVLRHFQKGSEENKAAAQAVLQRLAAGNDLVARKAKETLEKPKTSPMDEMNALNGRIRILGGGRVIIRGDGGLLPGPAGAAIPVGGGVFKSVSVSIANGIKSVTTQDGERTVKLKELADKTITGEITQKKEGKDTTDKIEAKSAEELKEKFPEAFKVYEQHFGKKEGAGLFGIGLGGKAGDLKEIKTQQFKAMAEHLEKIKTQASLPEETRERIITSLQEHLDRLDAELKKLETNESKK